MFDDDDFSGILTKMGLSELQIKKTKDFIDYYYPVLDESFIHNTKVQFNGDSSFFVSIDMEDGCELFPVTILVDESGNCVEMDYPIINVINKDLILGTKVSPICIENCENPYYYKNYTIIEKQVIMNSKGEILYEGELGDVNKARLVNHYLLLEKDKYTDLQKEQIYFYCDNCIPGPYDYSDYIECPVCENDAEWDEKENCYICSECKTQIEGNHINEEQAIAIHEETIKKLAVLDFSEVFISEDVKAGKYICDTPEEREERVINEALCREYNEENGIYYEQEPNYVEPYITGKLYSIYDIWRRKLLFPFQPCKISAFPKEFPKGIYLANEKDLKNTICGYLYDSKPKSFPWALMADPFNDSSAKFINVYEGPMFLTASDTFRTGPHTGQSLLQVYKKEPSIIEKYILTDHMYVSTNALKELKDLENIKDNNRAFSMLLATRDSKLSFMPINDITDEIRGIGAYNSEERLFHVTFQASWYNKMTLVDVFKKDPQYIISLVELNDIHIESSVLDKLENNDRIQELRNSLKKQKERQEESCDRYNSEYESYMLKMEIEDGLKEAYNSDPDALWNTD